MSRINGTVPVVIVGVSLSLSLSLSLILLRFIELCRGTLWRAINVREKRKDEERTSDFLSHSSRPIYDPVWFLLFFPPREREINLSARPVARWKFSPMSTVSDLIPWRRESVGGPHISRCHPLATILHALIILVSRCQAHLVRKLNVCFSI